MTATYSITASQVKDIKTAFATLKPQKVTFDGNRAKTVPARESQHLRPGSDLGADEEARLRHHPTGGEAAREGHPREGSDSGKISQRVQTREGEEERHTPAR